jgi:hypothetical protein
MIGYGRLRPGEIDLGITLLLGESYFRLKLKDIERCGCEYILLIHTLILRFYLLIIYCIYAKTVSLFLLR